MRLEHWWFTIPLRLKSIFRRRQVELDLEEELQFHLEHRIEEGIARGLSPQEARLQAMRGMDGLEQRKEEIRDARRVRFMTDFLDDLRFAARSLRRTPGLTALVVTTLALGIGMTATPFSMMDALIFRPYPVSDPDSVVSLVSTTRDNAFGSFSYREYLDLRDRTRSFDGVLASAPSQSVGFSAEVAATPRVKGGQLVSGNFFSVLGVEPQVGRGFLDSEDIVPDRDAVVVLGPDLWKKEFAADPGAIGRTVRLNGKDFTVIGVAPDSFPGLQIFSRPDFYVPLSMAGSFSTDPQKKFLEDRDDRQLAVKARLRRGLTLDEARGELAVLGQAFAREYPQTNRERGATVRTRLEMRTQQGDVNWKFSVVFSVLAVAVLLVACTNVAGLLLSRARTRTREIAIRLALGAGRFRLLRLLLAESLILSLLGGVGGVLVGFVGISLIRTFSIPSELPTLVPFRMDGRLLLASLAVSLLSAIFCGLAPALQSTRADLLKGLKASADVDIDGPRRLWGRNLLVVAQVSMSLMLLTATLLMDRGFRDSLVGGTGFPKDHLLMARFDPRLVQYGPAQTQQFYRRLAERLRETPGVVGAGLTQNPPLGLDAFGRVTFVPDGAQMPPGRLTFTSIMDTVDEGFFATMGIPVLRGRTFLASDTSDSPRVAIVNEHFARHYWPATEPLGQRIRLGGSAGPVVEIVGIAKAVRYQDGGEKDIDFAYFPLTQNPAARMVVLLRTSGDPLQWVDAVKQAARSLDANLPVSEMRTYEDLYRYHAVEGPGVAVRLVGTMGTVGLFLACAGLYGLMAYNVSRRTREIGIRMAIGAGARDVLALVMGKGIALVALGTLIGLALGAGVERLMNAMLFNAGRVDVVAYLLVVPSMFLATMLATYVPARRASKIAPTQALRYE